MVESSRLLPGDRVRVRSPQEILATLDPEGCLQGMPFMPEMLAHAGQEFRVFKRADKTCDSIAWSGLRQLDNTVHLAGLRCDGSAHGGCQAGCLFYWNEAWLQGVTPADSAQSANAQSANAQSANAQSASAQGANAQISSTAVQGAIDCAADEAVRAALQRHTTRGTTAEGEPIYRCQTTEVLRASKPLPWYRPGQYWRDM